ncbi:hypothetical protein INT44_008888 [Umbelopsis vinacea]|uniref:Uncharacterized protein n=1 Tax=Umbelopsis vinacea TaxID=44442 RepID=A0A8H7UJD0_9FUNG|nr:hypothetical protein INT44_008888 [Umbelopsis vinacea]
MVLKFANPDEYSYSDADSYSKGSDNQSVQNHRTSKGKRLVNTYIPADDLADLILHRHRAMDILPHEVCKLQRLDPQSVQAELEHGDLRRR